MIRCMKIVGKRGVRKFSTTADVKIKTAVTAVKINSAG